MNDDTQWALSNKRVCCTSPLRCGSPSSVAPIRPPPRSAEKRVGASSIDFAGHSDRQTDDLQLHVRHQQTMDLSAILAAPTVAQRTDTFNANTFLRDDGCWDRIGCHGHGRAWRGVAWQGKASPRKTRPHVEPDCLGMYNLNLLPTRCRVLGLLSPPSRTSVGRAESEQYGTGTGTALNGK